VLSDLLAILDPRAVLLTGAVAAFVMAALTALQIKTAAPFGRPLVLQSFAQLIISIALYFGATSIYDFSVEFTLRAFVPATLGYGLAMASILAIFQEKLPVKTIIVCGILILLGYVIWPDGVSSRLWNSAVQLLVSVATIALLLKNKAVDGSKIRLVAVLLCLFFGLGSLPKILFILENQAELGTALSAQIMDAKTFRFAALVTAGMPVLMYACILGTIQAQIAAKLRLSVHHDMLTGAHSRRFLFEKGNELLQAVASKKRGAAEGSGGATVLMIDVDHFKQFNDTWGHLVGDRVLRHCVELMQQVVRDTDAIVCRYGGEEFCVLVPEMPLENARAMSERIRLAVAEQPYMHLDLPLPITVSIGVAQQPDQATLAALIHTADERLYMAKRAGRNRVIDASADAPMPMQPLQPLP
jgi:diguanylate cyclase (GGDEF)-like protein